MTSDRGRRVLQQQSGQGRASRSLHVVDQCGGVVLGLRRAVQVEHVNGPRPIGRVVGLKMLKVPYHRTMDAFFLGWALGHKPSGMQGRELGIGPDFDGFRFVLLEQGAVTLPTILVAR